eukprot:TRINITY_DN17332_c0_g1_i1.p1 TRINITY_DN17332_c0_g1~~TRINITY_DN17332_c0_g1_i1.p1  ORF type:complete len:245 (+),score=49.70 TRINITY_DN17332_c0_g1_i1:160-894(+)
MRFLKTPAMQAFSKACMGKKGKRVHVCDMEHVREVAVELLPEWVEDREVIVTARILAMLVGAVRWKMDQLVFVFEGDIRHRDLVEVFAGTHPNILAGDSADIIKGIKELTAQRGEDLLLYTGRAVHAQAPLPAAHSFTPDTQWNHLTMPTYVISRFFPRDQALAIVAAIDGSLTIPAPSSLPGDLASAYVSLQPKVQELYSSLVAPSSFIPPSFSPYEPVGDEAALKVLEKYRLQHLELLVKQA